ncbi:MAG: hypothetical protein ACK4ON_07565 [Bacteroidia bacterium]
MKQYGFLVLSFISACVLLSDCNAFNAAEEIPSYIEIDTSYFSVNDPIKEGSASHKITDAWVYINNDLRGVYELPAKFPVLDKNDCDVTIRPGIKMNGISATRVNYLLYKPFTTRLNFTPLSQHKITPRYTYHDNLKFPFKEDFETSNSFENYISSDTSIIRVSNPDLVFEGNFSGALYLDTEKNYFKAKAVSANKFKLPDSGKTVFLEMNYKCNNTFAIGFGSQYNVDAIETLLIILNPSPNWNKIYINFTEEASKNATANEHFFYIEALLNPGIEKAEIFIDNLKIVHAE